MDFSWPADVADVPVKVGPRNRRRLTVAGVALAAVALCALGLRFFGGLPFFNTTSHSASPAPVTRRLVLIPDGLVYGMTKQQVQTKIGKPEKIAGNCWQYHEGVKNFVGQTINAVRVCFYDNIYSTTFYQQIDGLWRDPSSTRHVIPPPTQ